MRPHGEPKHGRSVQQISDDPRPEVARYSTTHMRLLQPEVQPDKAILKHHKI